MIHNRAKSNGFLSRKVLSCTVWVGCRTARHPWQILFPAQPVHFLEMILPTNLQIYRKAAKFAKLRRELLMIENSNVALRSFAPFAALR